MFISNKYNFDYLPIIFDPVNDYDFFFFKLVFLMNFERAIDY